MTGKEFRALTEGLSVQKIAKLYGRSVATINFYIYDRLPIPADVAKNAMLLKKMLDEFGAMAQQKNPRNLKKLINGRHYCTGSAVMLGKNWNEKPENDLEYLREELYVTNRGEYFFCGVGGGCTRYAKSGCTGMNIFPTTKEYAIRWMLSHGTPEEIEAAFPGELEKQENENQ